MTPRTLLLAAVLLAPTALSAQTTRATFIDWGNVTASVYPDATLGVQLWVGTSYRAVSERTRSVSLSFAPDPIYTWADGAALVVTPARPPRDSLRILTTPPLRALDGSGVRLLRRAAGATWEERVVISFEPRDTTITPLNIAARPEEARAFVDGLYKNAAASALATDWADRMAGRGRTQCADPAQYVPAAVASGVVPQYPITALSSGRALLEFVIGADGYVDRQTVVAIATTDEIFVRPSIDAVVRTRFTPATCRGAPMAIVVRQSVNYVR